MTMGISVFANTAGIRDRKKDCAGPDFLTFSGIICIGIKICEYFKYIIALPQLSM
jgi:hypothetical protein